MRAPRVMIRARMPERLVRSTASMRVPSARAPKAARRACAAPASDIAASALTQSAVVRIVLSDDIVLALPLLAARRATAGRVVNTRTISQNWAAKASRPGLTRQQPIERRTVGVEANGERRRGALIASCPEIA